MGGRVLGLLIKTKQCFFVLVLLRFFVWWVGSGSLVVFNSRVCFSILFYSRCFSLLFFLLIISICLSVSVVKRML